MKCKLSAVVVAGLLGLGAVSNAGAATVAIYTFGTSPATSLLSTDTDSSSTASAITVGAGLAGAGFTTTQGQPASAYSIPDTGVAGLGTPASDDYLRFTVTPSSAFNLTQIGFDASRWNNGSSGRISVSYSIGGGSFTDIDAFTIGNGGFNSYLKALTLTNVSAPVTFQFLFSRVGNVGNENQLADRGTYIDNITVEGTPVPIPAAGWLLGSVLLGLVGIRRRRH